MLNTIHSPADLRALPIADLPSVCNEIRQRIVDVVSRKGGHLSSSLGAVELCVALHYCLNTPEDMILFDVGHQAYAHKILTGRNQSFEHLREAQGISGFPNCFESEYDPFCSGHSSDAVSLALGLAEAKRLKKSRERVVAVIGDGSLTGGMCFEALNQAGHLGSDMLVVLNHNEMSIAASVGALSNYLNKIISKPIYNRIRHDIVHFLMKSSVGEKIAPHLKKLEEVLKGIVIPGIFFEEIGFRYFGPFDGHDTAHMTATIKNILEIEGPKILHVITKKGKGYHYAEKEPERFHSAGPFNKETGQFISSKTKGAEESFTAVFGKALVELGAQHPHVCAITAAMPLGTGLQQFSEKFPKRFFDVGIAEANALGVAAGLSKQGFKVFVAIYSTFLQRAYDQLIENVALQKRDIVCIIDRAGVVGEDGPTHHGILDIAYTRTIPDVVIMAPKGKEELEQMLEFSVGCKQPCFIRFPKDTAPSYESHSMVQFQQAEILAEGEDVLIIAVGTLCRQALEAQKQLKKEQISAAVLNPRFLKPFDEAAIRSMAERCKHVVIAEDGVTDGGFGAAVVEFFNRGGLLSQIQVVTLGFPSAFIPCGKREALLAQYGLDSAGMIKAVHRMIPGHKARV